MGRKIYIHIPRTGGNSILSSIGKSFDGNVIQHDLRDPGYLFYCEQKLSDDVVFSFVRHPVSRALSAYNFLRHGGLHPPDAQDAYHIGIKIGNFEQFVQEKLETVSRWQIHFIPQSIFLSGAQNLRLYYFEEFESAFWQFCQDANIKAEKLQHLNRSISDHKIINNLSAKTIDTIQRVYKSDFEALGY